MIPTPTGRVVVLSGAGLSAASGVPTFRSHGGLWRTHRFQDLATPEAWSRDADLVREFYDWRREKVLEVQPNPGHHALVRLQAEWGADRVALVTQNVDGLLQRAAMADGVDADILEMHGSLLRLRCERSESHPTHPLLQPTQPVDGRCTCGGRLRPAVVWFGEVPHFLDRIEDLLLGCQTFLAVGTSGVVYPAAGFVRIAHHVGATCIEVNPEPTGGGFHHAIAEGSETALPRLVEAWLAG